MSDTIEPPPPQPYAAQPSYPVQPGRHHNPSAVVSLIGGAMVLVGTLMPWGTVSSPVYTSPIEKGGMEFADGLYVLLLGIMIVIFSIRALAGAESTIKKARANQAATFIVCVIVGIFAVYDINSIQQLFNTLLNNSSYQWTGTYAPVGNYIQASVGSGLFLVIIGAVLAALGSLIPIQLANASVTADGGPCLGCQAAFLRSKASAPAGRSGIWQECRTCGRTWRYEVS